MVAHRTQEGKQPIGWSHRHRNGGAGAKQRKSLLNQMAHRFDHPVREPVDLFIGQTVGRYAFEKAGDHRRSGLIALQGVGQTVGYQPFQLSHAEGSCHMDHRQSFLRLLPPAARQPSDKQRIKCVNSIQIYDRMSGQCALDERL